MKRTHLILRLDDFSAISDSGLERQIFDAVRSRGAKIVVGIIPFVAEPLWPLRGPVKLLPLPEEKIALIREFMPETVEPALHGYCHVAVSGRSQFMDFSDRPGLQRQIELLRDAKDYLENALGTAIKAFIPPWHQYGTSTIDALRATGFRVISSQARFGPHHPGLLYIPATTTDFRISKELRLAESDPGAAICILIHEYEFRENGLPEAKYDLGEFGAFLEECSMSGALWTGFAACVERGDWGVERAHANMSIRRRPESEIYWSERVARHLGGLSAIRRSLRRIRRRFSI